MAFVRVIEERPVSLALAEKSGVVHKSPQVVLVKNRTGVWSESHGRITTAVLKEVVARG